MKLTTKILLSLLVGAVVGLFMTGNPGIANTFIKPVGTLFINLITMVIVPLVLASLVVGAASLGDMKTLGRIGGKTLTYYLLTTAFAVTLGLILGSIIEPGIGLTVSGKAQEAAKAPSAIDTILNIIPKNPVKALADGSMLQIIVFALFLGVGASALPDGKGKPVINFFDSMAEVMYKVTSFIMEFAPIGVFGLIVPVVAANGPKVLLPLIKVILAVYIGCILHAVLVYSTSVKIFANYSPIKYFKGIMPAALTAFTTCSSSATLPVTMKSVKENLGVSDRIASFVLPLGATVNMDGTALYQGVCALFVAQLYGIDLTAAQYATIVLTATLASIGTAGVPGAGLIMLSMVLTSVGLPLEGVALIAGIDRVLDMIRTCVNVVGDTSAAVVIAASEKELNVSAEKISA